MINNLFLVIIVMIISTLIGSIGSLLLKKGSEHFDIDIRKGITKTVMKLLKNYNVVFGAILYFVSASFFIYLLRIEDLSMLYPMTSLSYVFVTILSVYILKERLNVYKTFGIMAIIIGVVLVTL